MMGTGDSLDRVRLDDIEQRLTQLLQENVAKIRSEAATRDMRMSERLDLDRNDRQAFLEKMAVKWEAAIAELRRDLTARQVAELAEQEERVTRRLDTERREVKATTTELRMEIDAQQDVRAQVTSLRRDLGTTQSALSKLAGVARPSNSGPGVNVASSGTNSAVEGTSEVGNQLSRLVALEAAFTNLEREVKLGPQDLSRERSERCSALAHVGKSIEDLLGRVRAVEIQVLAGKGSITPETIVGLSRSESRGIEAPCFEATLEHQLAACVGELDAELRVELSQRMNNIREELRDQLGKIEAILAKYPGIEVINMLELRLGELEGARLDLRVGALEAAAQHGSVFANQILEDKVEDMLKNSKWIPQVICGSDDAAWVSSPHTLGHAELAVRELSTMQVPSDTKSAPTRHLCEDIDISRPMPPMDVGQMLSPGDSASQIESQVSGSGLQTVERRIEARLQARLDGRLQEFVGATACQKDNQEATEQDVAAYLHIANSLADAAAAVAQPLISNDLKERLESLVNQVKMGGREPSGSRQQPCGGAFQVTLHDHQPGSESHRASLLHWKTEANPPGSQHCPLPAVEAGRPGYCAIQQSQVSPFLNFGAPKPPMSLHSRFAAPAEVPTCGGILRSIRISDPEPCDPRRRSASPRRVLVSPLRGRSPSPSRRNVLHHQEATLGGSIVAPLGNPLPGGGFDLAGVRRL